MTRFSCIVIDPPWSFSDKLNQSDVKRGADANYNTMSISALKTLDIASLADPEGCVLAMWCVGSMLQEALDLMKVYGFDQKQVYVWVKTKRPSTKKKDIGKKLSVDDCLAFGMGRLFRQTHELCLVGINTTKIYKKLKNKSQRSVSFFENKKHSAKPEALQDSFDIMFPNEPKLEIFARRVRPGWECIGNEVCDGEDIRDSIKRLNEVINVSQNPSSEP